MMASEEDDYLSDKFLIESISSAPKTYRERRKEAQRLAQLKNEQNRIKSRRQRELESREEGLSKSLFTRAKEEEESGVGGGSKALSIMMKMGFRPGQGLGKQEDADLTEGTSEPDAEQPAGKRAEPLPLLEWDGKVGIGLRKRPPPSSAAERLAKMAKLEERAGQETFRDRTRREYEERRAEGRLLAAQTTCRTLDEKIGISFNVLCLNPNDNDSFPEGLLDTLYENAASPLQLGPSKVQSTEARLRQQMQADRLQPIGSEDEDALPSGKLTCAYSMDTIQEALQLLRLNAVDRLQLTLEYLREKHLYCFWCGTQYTSDAELQEQCPGVNEEDHD